jgi:23S rRNA U2552 (ribose-2'-O)-methylase RlmE/FtsJ
MVKLLFQFICFHFLTLFLRLQVAQKYMPIASIKIGVDLVPIRAVKGCMTFKADITTPKCINLVCFLQAIHFISFVDQEGAKAL